MATVASVSFTATATFLAHVIYDVLGHLGSVILIVRAMASGLAGKIRRVTESDEFDLSGYDQARQGSRTLPSLERRFQALLYCIESRHRAHLSPPRCLPCLRCAQVVEVPSLVALFLALEVRCNELAKAAFDEPLALKAGSETTQEKGGPLFSPSGPSGPSA